MGSPMNLPSLPVAIILGLTLLLSSCTSTPSPTPSPNSGRAEVRIDGISPAELQTIIVSHMTSLGYRQVDAAPGFLVVERTPDRPPSLATRVTAATSRIQMAIQELAPSSLAVYAIEYSVYRSGDQWIEKEVTANQIFMQALLEGFKAKALYGPR